MSRDLKVFKDQSAPLVQQEVQVLTAMMAQTDKMEETVKMALKDLKGILGKMGYQGLTEVQDLKGLKEYLEKAVQQALKDQLANQRQ